MQDEHTYKKTFARWFQDLDLRETPDFINATEAAEIEKRLELNLRQYALLQSSPPANTFKLPFWGIASAASFLLIGLSALLFFVNNQKQQQAADHFYELSTAIGEKKIVTLTDGTKIYVNNSSKIKYAKSYTGKTRTVFLEGEAYFEVTHNKERPFIVNSGKLKVHVLGTSFNVSSYKFEPKIAVTVSTGKVGVIENGKPKAWMLNPGAQLSYTKQSGRILVSQVNETDFSGWISGKLFFNNERMDVVCAQLSRTYGVIFNMKTTEINSKRINLKINNESIGTIVKMLALSSQFKYSIKGKEITIW
jgi:transmembrane sensor